MFLFIYLGLQEAVQSLDDYYLLDRTIQVTMFRLRTGCNRSNSHMYTKDKGRDYCTVQMWESTSNCRTCTTAQKGSLYDKIKQPQMSNSTEDSAVPAGNKIADRF